MINDQQIPAEPPSVNLEGITGLLIAVGILIILSMIFSASESAFLSINKLRIRFLRSKKNKKAIKTGHLLDKKEQLLNTILVGNNIVNIAITSLLTSIALQLFGQAGIGIATLITTIILLIFGEITPKTIASKHPEPIAFLFSGFIQFFMKIMSPFVFVFTWISRNLTKLLGIKYNKKNVSFTEEEIKSFIDVGEEEGVLEENEKKMMHRVFKFTDLEAHDVMVPRTRIIAVQVTASYQDVLELSQRTRLSRFPVFKNDIDNIVGILYIKDLLFYHEKAEDFSIQKIMRPPLFVIGTKKMSSVQQMLRENKQSLAVVIDEYSGTAGILSIEDITKEIFGTTSNDFYNLNVIDNLDISTGKTYVAGSTRLIDISEKLGIKLNSEFYETIAGFITERLDRIPVVNDKITESGFSFQVTEADETRVKQIKICKEDSSWA